MRAVAYCAGSPDALRAQETRIRELAAARGITLVRLYVDHSLHSGRLSRGGIAHLLDDLGSQNDWTHVLADRPDVLFRTDRQPRNVAVYIEHARRTAIFVRGSTSAVVA